MIKLGLAASPTGFERPVVVPFINEIKIKKHLKLNKAQNMHNEYGRLGRHLLTIAGIKCISDAQENVRKQNVVPVAD